LLKYSFKMEKVLEYRSNMEKTKVEDYANINILLNKEKEHLDNLESEYNSKTKKTATNVSEMKIQLMYKEKLKKQLSSQKKKVDEISTNLEDARGNLIEARKDRKIMEKLKEKDKEKFDAVAASNEQKELDDISIMKYAR
jgi:flagellar protein FliJ